MKIDVAPLVGARIEMPKKGTDGITQKSLPSRERGLKFKEIRDGGGELRRSPRGSAD